MKITDGGLDDARVQTLLAHHFATARAETAPGSAHALNLSELKSPDVHFWSAWSGDRVIAIGALKRLSESHGEVKSMHTEQSHRCKGAGSAMLRHIIEKAREMGLSRLSLETGSWPYFIPAREFYKKHGFVECPPFGSYLPDPNSVFMTLELAKDPELKATTEDEKKINPNIRQALPQDTNCAVAILREAAEWLEQSGRPMWRDNELLPSQLAADVNAGLVFLAECGGEPAGVVKFQLEDRWFWPDVPQDEAAYVHRLAVKRRFAGGRVSSALLGWAVDRARLLGREFVRLDCEASRTRLRAVYERFGFQHHSNREVGPYFVSRYQYRVQSAPGHFNQLGLAPGELRFVTVGPEWTERFAREHRRIAKATGTTALDIQHIGSTSVPGIIAKPVLDIAMAIRDFESGFALVQPLVALGYTYRGENGIPRRHYFELGWAIHLHVFEQSGGEWGRHLRFRDRLRASPELAARYSEIKRTAAKESEENISRYQELKSPFIRETQRS